MFVNGNHENSELHIATGIHKSEERYAKSISQRFTDLRTTDSALHCIPLHLFLIVAKTCTFFKIFPLSWRGDEWEAAVLWGQGWQSVQQHWHLQMVRHLRTHLQRQFYVHIWGSRRNLLTYQQNQRISVVGHMANNKTPHHNRGYFTCIFRITSKHKCQLACF